jgi:hypothetical protein
MVRYLLLSVVLVLLLATCGPSGQVDTEAPPTTDGPALVPAAGNPRPTPTNEETGRLEPGQVITGEVVPGGSVDLGQLTPVAPPAGGGAAVELPAPGVPNPAVKMANLAMQDLSARLGIDISQITLVETEAVEWPDAGLGCPAEGMMYAAVITPGYRIILLTDGDSYIYHADSIQQVVLCLDGQAAPPANP